MKLIQRIKNNLIGWIVTIFHHSFNLSTMINPLGSSSHLIHFSLTLSQSEFLFSTLSLSDLSLSQLSYLMFQRFRLMIRILSLSRWIVDWNEIHSTKWMFWGEKIDNIERIYYLKKKKEERFEESCFHCKSRLWMASLLQSQIFFLIFFHLLLIYNFLLRCVNVCGCVISQAITRSFSNSSFFLDLDELSSSNLLVLNCFFFALKNLTSPTESSEWNIQMSLFQN